MASQTTAAPSYWALLARKIEQNPSLLDTVMCTIDRWLAEEHSASHRLVQWRQLVLAAQRQPAALSALLRILTSEDPADSRLRDFNPFPGILTREERRQTRELCGYRH